MNQLNKKTMKTLSLRLLTLFIIGLVSITSLKAQSTDKSKRPSPPAMATGKIGEANITIDYSSPSVKGRKIFGGLEPYGKVWRAGANEATIISTDKDITVGGKTLKAGKYSFFATPGETEWTVFFNSETGQWGTKKGGEANMDATKTVVSLPIAVKKLDQLVEKLEYVVSNTGIELRWEYASIFIEVK